MSCHNVEGPAQVAAAERHPHTGTRTNQHLSSAAHQKLLTGVTSDVAMVGRVDRVCRAPSAGRYHPYPV